MARKSFLGEFSTTSAYQKLNDNSKAINDNLWNQIWNLQVPQRVPTFMWLVKHGRLQTAGRIAKWSNAEPFCHHCQQVDETMLHVLWVALLPEKFGFFFIPFSSRSGFFGLSFINWLLLI